MTKCDECNKPISIFGGSFNIDGKTVCPACEKKIRTGQEQDEVKSGQGWVILGFIIIGLSLFLGVGGAVCALAGIVVGAVFILVGLLSQTRKAQFDKIVDKIEKSSKPEENPLEVLKMRYAKGEITKEEFEKMKKDLED